MTQEEQFICWLQGFAEMRVKPPTAEEWNVIRERLAKVFTKTAELIQTPEPAKTTVPFIPLHPPFEPIKWPPVPDKKWTFPDEPKCSASLTE